jgi:hypothetical protein
MHIIAHSRRKFAPAERYTRDGVTSRCNSGSPGEHLIGVWPRLNRRNAMETEVSVFVHARVCGRSYTRAFPTFSAARAFVLRRHDQNGVSDMWIEDREGRVVTNLGDFIGNVGSVVHSVLAAHPVEVRRAYG